MIFVSHNHKDKELVEPIAIKLSTAFGQENIFYDSWSMQPGDSLIGKMNEGLEKCEFFFYFVSQNSLKSNMVNLEWQAALLKETQNKTNFIAVKIEKVELPTIISSKVYIDLYRHGIDVAIRQIVDIVNGINTFTPTYKEFCNWEAKTNYINNDEIHILVQAKRYMEPISRFLILLDNNMDEVKVSVTNVSFHSSGFKNDIMLNNGNTYNGFFIDTKTPTTPEFPTKIVIKKAKEKPINFIGILYAKDEKNWKIINCMEDAQLNISE